MGNAHLVGILLVILVTFTLELPWLSMKPKISVRYIHIISMIVLAHKHFFYCSQADNASMPYLVGTTNYYVLYDFLRKQQQWFLYSDRVWVQHIDRINECTRFAYNAIELGDCLERHPFICEIGTSISYWLCNNIKTCFLLSDPKIYIDPLVWQGDALTIAIICSIALAIILLALLGACWWSKSKYRQAQRFERRNSIRRSLQSLRSVGTTNGFSDAGYRRRPGQLVGVWKY